MIERAALGKMETHFGKHKKSDYNDLLQKYFNRLKPTVNSAVASFFGSFIVFIETHFAMSGDVFFGAVHKLRIFRAFFTSPFCPVTELRQPLSRLH